MYIPSSSAYNNAKLGGPGDKTRSVAQTHYSLKASSQSYTRPCIALIRELHKFITKKSGFLTTKRKITTQENARIGSESILVSCCVSTSVDAKMTQCNALFSVVL